MPQPSEPRMQKRKEPQQKRGQQTVAAILKATRILLADAEDARELSTNAIAAKAGVSIGTYYQYFPNREALYGELVIGFLDDLFAKVSETLSATRDWPLAEFATTFVDQIMEFHRASAAVMQKLKAVVTWGLMDFDGYERFHQDVLTLCRRELNHRRQLFPDRNLEVMAFMLTYAIAGSLYQASVKNPEYFASSDFKAELYRLFASYTSHT